MENSEEDFTFNIQKLIIRTRLDMESDFQEGRKKKSVLWGKILLKIKEIKPDFEMTKEQISRKFLNLHTTYKRIKVRNNKTGRNATSWEFYDIFDEVYGTKHSINPALKNLQSSLNATNNPEDEQPETSLNGSLICSETSADECRPPTKKRHTLKEDNATLNFLKEEAKKDEKRHKEIVELENRKIEVERERIKAMLELKEDNETLNFLKEEAKKDEERHKEIVELENRKIKVERERIKAMLELKNILQKMVDK